MYIIGIDIGGTFTDVACIDANGKDYLAKADSTPEDFSLGVLDALRVLSQEVGCTMTELLQKTRAIKHGTTVGTNALITGQGARVGFLTTQGFEDTTLIARAIGRVAGLGEAELRHPNLILKPTPIVPRTRIRGICERIDSQGRVVAPLDVAQARQAIQQLVEDEQVEAIAVSFLWSFMNDTHERQVEQLIRDMYPHMSVNCSYRIAPVIREYARANTVIINAFLDETMREYVANLLEALNNSGFAGSFYITQANGGVVLPEEMEAIGTVSSGPAGGMIASQFFSSLLENENVISTDMGGTSFEVGIIDRGQWKFERNPILGRWHVSVPRIDVESIGAGGGTIASVEEATGRLQVGPASAGSRPGPVCYDRGGEHPTVTDVDLVLGYIDPNYFLGGRKKLNYKKAYGAITEKLAKPLSMSTEEAAAAVYEIINAKMADLIRKKVVTTGSMPEQFTLYCYGGAAAVHAAEFSRPLHIKELVVFSQSPVLSAFGAATSDIMLSRVRSFRYVLPGDPSVLDAVLREVEEQLVTSLRGEGVDPAKISVSRLFHMRFRKQVNELAITMPAKSPLTLADMELLEHEFLKKFEQEFGKGSAQPELGIEIISVTINVRGETPKPLLAKYAEQRDIAPEPVTYRDAFFNYPDRGYLSTPVYRYETLMPAQCFAGPAIVEGAMTTVVVPPQYECSVDPFRNLRLRLAAG